ncbi:hypothetical protein [Mycolicibacterium sphagni]|uniref:Uncharacterized protein n=1 Tax=Mycolicibacterium sphagni TaxID=1786 RepID=A0A255DME7_9MYCO|nr:hypothetical protein [Mycolicibacterium sphagni]OYN80424.1 hypothetical protein CG716_09865 [Mycolicibacterium sphagni]
MDPLASLDDVAHALGLADEAALGGAKVFRANLLLPKISREFRREAGRQFTPGRTKVKLITVAGRVTLPDGLGDGGEVHSVTGVDNLHFEVDDDELVLTVRRRSVGTGVVVKLDYTHREEVPEEVKGTVAAIVARYLTVDPTSAVAQSTFLASEQFQQRFADWVSSSVKLTDDDIDFARSYRDRPVTVIVLR